MEILMGWSRQQGERKREVKPGEREKRGTEEPTAMKTNRTNKIYSFQKSIKLLTLL
jgi:hypothetical protein